MRKLFMLGTIVPVLFLSACDGSWEMQPYHGTPYGDRTAGSGVEYVRAHLMPEKGPVIKPAQPAAQSVIVPVPEYPAVMEEAQEENGKGIVDKMINSGEKFFRDLQKK